MDAAARQRLGIGVRDLEVQDEERAVPPRDAQGLGGVEPAREEAPRGAGVSAEAHQQGREHLRYWVLYRDPHIPHAQSLQ